MIAAAASNSDKFIAILGAASLVIGLVAVIALAVFFIKKGPPDGSDIGRDPRLDADEQRRRNGSGKHTHKP